MAQKIVKIVKVSKYAVTMSNGLSASRDLFPGAKTGQKWEVVIEQEERYNGGLIVRASLTQGAERDVSKARRPICTNDPDGFPAVTE